MHDDAYKPPQPQGLFPEKLFYKIGEVSRLVGVESYVLRYWETEFPFLNPRKSKSGQRIYTKSDIDVIGEIKRLLYEEQYTIGGVRRRFSEAADVQKAALAAEQEQKLEKKEPDTDAGAVLNMVKSRLRDLLHHYFGA